MEVLPYAILHCFAAEHGNLVVITLNWAHSVVVWLLFTVKCKWCGNVSCNIGNVSVWNNFFAGLSRNGGGKNIPVDPLHPSISRLFTQILEKFLNNFVK